MSSNDTRTFRSADLVNLVRTIVLAAGSSSEEADAVATNLVEANLRGHDSHGVGMVPRYVDAVREGGLTINQHVRVVQDSGALLTLDGGHGYGQVIGREAMALAIDRAQRFGVCVTGLAHSHHLGRIGQWAEQCAAAGLVSIHFVNVIARPIVAPFGGRDARFGTNPFCVAIPRAGAQPVVLDFATSKIAQGKTRVAHNKGVALEPDTLIDHLGNPTTDPRYTVVEPSGALLPFGAHKGSGLALICELLGGALAGGITTHDRGDGQRRVLNSMFSIVVDAQKMGTAENLARELEAFVGWYAASPPAAGVETVLVAGDPERATKAKRLLDGIEIDTTTWREIVEAGAKVGVERSQLEALAPR